MKVNDILRNKGTEVVRVPRSTTARQAAAILRERNIGALLVEGDDHGQRGLVTERDIVRQFAEHGESIADHPVTALLSPTMRTCREDDSVRDVMTQMTTYRVRHLPVLGENDHVVGIISIGDVIKHRLNEIETEKNVLRDIVTAST